MLSKIDKIEIMISDTADKVVEELFKSLIKGYQIPSKKSMRDSAFIFGCVYLFYYCKCHKMIFKQRGWNIESPDWLKKNPINKKDNKCFQYAIRNASNHEEIKNYLQRIKKVKPFVNKSNWERINFPSEIHDWKKIGKNKATIALNVLHANKEIADPAYVSKHNSNYEKEVIFLMAPYWGENGIILQ